MEDENKAVQSEEMVSEQESPTAEEPIAEPGMAEQPNEEEKNWKAVREELKAKDEALKAKEAEIEKLKQQGVTSEKTQVRGSLDAIYLDTNETIALDRQELKAELKFPELENGEDPFTLAVWGKYRKGLDGYIQAKASGRSTNLPNVYDIATSIRGTWDKTFGEINRKAEVEGAKKAREAVSSKEATIEAEAGGTRAKLAKAGEELDSLKYKSRLGGQHGIDAIAERLSRSGL